MHILKYKYHPLKNFFYYSAFSIENIKSRVPEMYGG